MPTALTRDNRRLRQEQILKGYEETLTYTRFPREH